MDLVDWQKRGVNVMHPESTFIDPAVPEHAISEGTVLYPGTRILGASTVIGKNCILGKEAPLTISDSVLSHDVSFAGGYMDGSVAWNGVQIASGAHIRPGCILEERSSVAHSVGLKQTLFMPFATAGSLINFCDAFLAGGTGPKNHSEIGSSYVHFNFTPQADKATPSQVGDVPRGVMLDQKPIFLGGQGGMVGPCKVAYGVTVAAGTVLREDILDEGHLYKGGENTKTISMPYDRKGYRGLERKLKLNVEYIGQLLAWSQWYTQFRAAFFGDDVERACLAAGNTIFNKVIAERMKWLGTLQEGIAETGSAAQAEKALAHFLKQDLATAVNSSEAALKTWANDVLTAKKDGEDYISFVQSLSAKDKEEGSSHLQAVVDAVTALLDLE